MFDWKKVPGHGHSDEEREWFKETAEAITARFDPSATIINIGVYRGCSMHCFRAGAPTAKLFGIDVKKCDIFEPDILNAPIIRANSTKWHINFHTPIHLLFIDGSHKPQDVRKDIDGWGPRVVIGGIMALHDYERTEEDYKFRGRSCGARQLVGVREAVDEWWDEPDKREEWREIPAVGSIRAFERVMAGEAK